MAAVKALQQWCRVQCEGYRDVTVTNMTTSFRDGLAFCALIHRHRPDLINFDSLKKENVYDNNKLAFSVAEEQLGIPALLDAEDMVALAVPDRLSILTYVSQYYNCFHGRNPIGGMAGVKRPAEGATEQQPAGKKNQPVRAKVFTSSGPSKENNPPPEYSKPAPAKAPRHSTTNRQDVAGEGSPQTGTLSNKCVSCNKHVHLVQRYLVDGRLYHRNCAKTLSGGSFTADIHKNSLSRLTPDPSPAKTSPKSGPTWLTQKPSTPSSVSSSASPPKPSRSTILFPPQPAKTNTTSVFPLRPTPSSPASKPRTTFESPPTAVTTTTPTPAQGTSITAKNLEAKRKFFQSADDNAEQKKTTNMVASGWKREESPARHSVSVVVQVGGKDTSVGGKGTSVGGKDTYLRGKNKNVGNDTRVGVKDICVGGTDTQVGSKCTAVGGKATFLGGKNISVGVKGTPVGVKDTSVGVKDTSVGVKNTSVGVKNTSVGVKDTSVGVKNTSVGVKDTSVGKEEEQNKTKTTAAAFISKMLTEENNNNKSTWSVTTKTDEKESLVEAPKKETDRPRGRVKLRANPSLLSDIQSTTTPTENRRAPIPANTRGLNITTPAGRRSPSPVNKALDPAAKKPRSPSPNISAAESESPSDWRARLKPVSKESRPSGSSQSSPKPWTNGSGLTPTPNLLTPASFGPSISVTPPAPKGFSSSPKHTGNEAHSKQTKKKPDYIPKEEIMRELQQIEDSLNELERTGVELELKLRTSEENGEDESMVDELMVEWFTLIRNKQVAMRRESELVYIGKTQELEEEQPTVEQELRHLMDKPEHLKSQWEQLREEELMRKLVEIVNDRNAIIEGLDEDRLREEEEDEQLNQLMMNFNLKKDKSKKKSSPMSRLFGWGGKKDA